MWSQIALINWPGQGLLVSKRTLTVTVQVFRSECNGCGLCGICVHYRSVFCIPPVSCERLATAEQ